MINNSLKAPIRKSNNSSLLALSSLKRVESIVVLVELKIFSKL